MSLSLYAEHCQLRLLASHLVSHAVVISTGTVWKNGTCWTPRPCRNECEFIYNWFYVKCKAIFNVLLNQTKMFVFFFFFFENMDLTVVRNSDLLFEVLSHFLYVTQHYVTFRSSLHVSINFQGERGSGGMKGSSGKPGKRVSYCTACIETTDTAFILKHF